MQLFRICALSAPIFDHLRSFALICALCALLHHFSCVSASDRLYSDRSWELQSTVGGRFRPPKSPAPHSTLKMLEPPPAPTKAFQTPVRGGRVCKSIRKDVPQTKNIKLDHLWVRTPWKPDQGGRQKLISFCTPLYWGKSSVHTFWGVTAFLQHAPRKSLASKNGGLHTKFQRNRPNCLRTKCREHAR